MLKITLSNILKIGMEIATARDYNTLLDLFLNKIMEITNSDAGTMYLYQDHQLTYTITKNNTLNIFPDFSLTKDKSVTLPMKEDNICAYSALMKSIVNVSDIYQNTKFDFSYIYRQDSFLEYHTKSMLVVPIQNIDNEVIGVLQLINAQNKNQEIIPFSSECEYIVFSLASQMAVALSNLNHLQETKELLNSIVSVMTTAIDESTPYNANHTRNVTKYASEFIDFLNIQFSKGNFNEYFDENRKAQLILAAQLHDIGKIVIPLKVMNKSTRLGSSLESIQCRLKLLEAYLKIDHLIGRIDQDQYENEISFLKKSLEQILAINTTPILGHDQIDIVHSLSSKQYIHQDGSVIPYIEEEEKECLLIPKGTLTNGERKIMERHVLMTTKLLDEIHFSNSYANVPIWASRHHEYLDGSGYPNQLSAPDIPTDVRILVIIDIFESLTSNDRPYKDPIPFHKAFEILEDMVHEGKIDATLTKQLKLFYLSK